MKKIKRRNQCRNLFPLPKCARALSRPLLGCLQIKPCPECHQQPSWGRVRCGEGDKCSGVRGVSYLQGTGCQDPESSWWFSSTPLGMGLPCGSVRGQAGPELLTLPQEVPQGRQRGQRAGARVRVFHHRPGLLLTEPLLWRDPCCSSINGRLFPPPVKAALCQNQ